MVDDHILLETLATDILNFMCQSQLISPICTVDHEHDVLIVESSAAVEQLAAFLQERVGVQPAARVTKGNRKNEKTKSTNGGDRLGVSGIGGLCSEVRKTDRGDAIC